MFHVKRFLIRRSLITMKNTILFFLCLTIACKSGMSHSQPGIPLQQPTVTLENDSDAGISGRTAQQILDYINEMREDPAGFYSKYLKEYIRQGSRRFTRYYTVSLEKDMRRAGNLPPFKVSNTMIKTASYQAKYLKHLGGHTLTHDAAGLSFEQRMQQAGVGCAGENLYTGENRTALQVVMDLLIDQGVSSLGHRKNLLNPQYKSIGVVVAGYSRGGNIVVMDFSCN